MGETIVVIAVIGLVTVLVVRSVHRTLAGKNDGCGCGCKGNCQANGSDPTISDEFRQDTVEGSRA
jgi:hypothetical protein